MNKPVDAIALVERARKLYESDALEIDDNSRVSVTENGFWVQAWVWVPDATAYTESEGLKESTADSKRHGGAW
jgi:hypothetical protein